jgi:hypothetical protein
LNGIIIYVFSRKLIIKSQILSANSDGLYEKSMSKNIENEVQVFKFLTGPATFRKKGSGEEAAASIFIGSP